MKEAVIIKSYQNGISLFLNEECEFSTILSEIESKFTASKNFFGKAKVALSLEGRKLDNAEESAIINAITSNSNLTVCCLIGKDEKTQKDFVKAVQKMEDLMPDEDCQFYKGTLKDHNIIETEKSIVILGDVYPGCSVISDKNIIVLGGLYGEAIAGNEKDNSCYVVALEMEPEKLRIGDFKYKTNSKPSKWGITSKVAPQIAYVKLGKVVCVPLTKDKLSSF